MIAIGFICVFLALMVFVAIEKAVRSEDFNYHRDEKRRK